MIDNKTGCIKSYFVLRLQKRVVRWGNPS